MPRTLTSPLSGARRPSRISTVVVLPAPFGPSKPKISPGATSKLTPSTAWTDPYALRTSPTRMTAPAASGRGARAVATDWLTLTDPPLERGVVLPAWGRARAVPPRAGAAEALGE